MAPHEAKIYPSTLLADEANIQTITDQTNANIEKEKSADRIVQAEKTTKKGIGNNSPNYYSPLNPMKQIDQVASPIALPGKMIDTPVENILDQSTYIGPGEDDESFEDQARVESNEIKSVADSKDRVMQNTIAQGANFKDDILETKNVNEIVEDSSSIQSSEPDEIPLGPYKDGMVALLKQYGVTEADIINEDNPKEQIHTYFVGTKMEDELLPEEKSKLSMENANGLSAGDMPNGESLLMDTHQGPSKKVMHIINTDGESRSKNTYFAYGIEPKSAQGNIYTVPKKQSLLISSFSQVSAQIDKGFEELNSLRSQDLDSKVHNVEKNIDTINDLLQKLRFVGNIEKKLILSLLNGHPKRHLTVKPDSSNTTGDKRTANPTFSYGELSLLADNRKLRDAIHLLNHEMVDMKEKLGQEEIIMTNLLLKNTSRPSYPRPTFETVTANIFSKNFPLQSQSIPSMDSQKSILNATLFEQQIGSSLKQNDIFSNEPSNKTEDVPDGLVVGFAQGVENVSHKEIDNNDREYGFMNEIRDDENEVTVEIVRDLPSKGTFLKDNSSKVSRKTHFKRNDTSTLTTISPSKDNSTLLHHLSRMKTGKNVTSEKGLSTQKDVDEAEVGRPMGNTTNANAPIGGTFASGNKTRGSKVNNITEVGKQNGRYTHISNGPSVNLPVNHQQKNKKNATNQLQSNISEKIDYIHKVNHAGNKSVSFNHTDAFKKVKNAQKNSKNRNSVSFSKAIITKDLLSSIDHFVNLVESSTPKTYKKTNSTTSIKSKVNQNIHNPDSKSNRARVKFVTKNDSAGTINTISSNESLKKAFLEFFRALNQRKNLIEKRKMVSKQLITKFAKNGSKRIIVPEHSFKLTLPNLSRKEEVEEMGFKPHIKIAREKNNKTYLFDIPVIKWKKFNVPYIKRNIISSVHDDSENEEDSELATVKGNVYFCEKPQRSRFHKKGKVGHHLKSAESIVNCLASNETNIMTKKNKEEQFIKRIFKDNDLEIMDSNNGNHQLIQKFGDKLITIDYPSKKISNNGHGILTMRDKLISHTVSLDLGKDDKIQKVHKNVENLQINKKKKLANQHFLVKIKKGETIYDTLQKIIPKTKKSIKIVPEKINKNQFIKETLTNKHTIAKLSDIKSSNEMKRTKFDAKSLTTKSQRTKESNLKSTKQVSTAFALLHMKVVKNSTDNRDQHLTTAMSNKSLSSNMTYSPKTIKLKHNLSTNFNASLESRKMFNTSRTNFGQRITNATNATFLKNSNSSTEATLRSYALGTALPGVKSRLYDELVAVESSPPKDSPISINDNSIDVHLHRDPTSQSSLITTYMLAKPIVNPVATGLDTVVSSASDDNHIITTIVPSGLSSSLKDNPKQGKLKMLPIPNQSVATMIDRPIASQIKQKQGAVVPVIKGQSNLAPTLEANLGSAITTHVNKINNLQGSLLPPPKSISYPNFPFQSNSNNAVVKTVLRNAAIPANGVGNIHTLPELHQPEVKTVGKSLFDKKDLKSKGSVLNIMINQKDTSKEDSLGQNNGRINKNPTYLLALDQNVASNILLGGVGEKTTNQKLANQIDLDQTSIDLAAPVASSSTVPVITNGNTVLPSLNPEIYGPSNPFTVHLNSNTQGETGAVQRVGRYHD